MGTIVRLFDVGQDVWVVNPSIPALYNGTVANVTMTEYLNGSNVLTNKITYAILLNDDSGTVIALEEHVKATQIEGLALLADLIDGISCY